MSCVQCSWLNKCCSELGEIGDTWLLSSFCATDFRTMMMLLTALLLWTLVSTNWTLHVCFPILLYVFSLFFIWNGIVCKEKWILLNCGTLFTLTTLCRINAPWSIRFNLSPLQHSAGLSHCKSLWMQRAPNSYIYMFSDTVLNQVHLHLNLLQLEPIGLSPCKTPSCYMYQLCFVFIIISILKS